MVNSQMKIAALLTLTMSAPAFAPTYEAKLSGSDDTQWILDLTLRAGKEAEFPRLKVWIDKTMLHPMRIEYSDASGKKLKTQVRSDYKKDAADHFNPGKVVVT